MLEAQKYPEVRKEGSEGGGQDRGWGPSGFQGSSCLANERKMFESLTVDAAMLVNTDGTSVPAWRRV